MQERLQKLHEGVNKKPKNKIGSKTARQSTPLDPGEVFHLAAFKEGAIPVDPPLDHNKKTGKVTKLGLSFSQISCKVRALTSTVAKTSKPAPKDVKDYRILAVETRGGGHDDPCWYLDVQVGSALLGHGSESLRRDGGLAAQGHGCRLQDACRYAACWGYHNGMIEWLR